MKLTLFALLTCSVVFLFACSSDKNEDSAKQDDLFNPDELIKMMLETDPKKASECKTLLDKIDSQYFANEHFFKNDTAIILLANIIFVSVGKVEDHRLIELLQQACKERPSCKNSGLFSGLISRRISRFSEGNYPEGGIYKDEVANAKILHFQGVENFALDSAKIKKLKGKGYKFKAYKKLE